MKCNAMAMLLPTSPTDAKGSAGETAGIDDEQEPTSTTFVIGIRQKVITKANLTELTFDGAHNDRVNKGEKGGARVPSPQGGYLVVAHLRKGGGTAALHFRKGGRVKKK